MLEVLELASCRRKHFLTNTHMIVHGATNVETQQNLNGVVTFRNHAKIEEAGIPRRLINRIFQVQ